MSVQRVPFEPLGGGDALRLEGTHDAGLQRRGDRRHRHTEVESHLGGPLARALLPRAVEDHIEHRLAGLFVGHGERSSGYLHQVPAVGSLGHLSERLVQLAVREAQHVLEAVVDLGDRLHDAILDAVVDVLDEVARLVVTDIRAARTVDLCGDGFEHSADDFIGFSGAAGHYARAFKGALCAAADTGADEQDASVGELDATAPGVAWVRVGRVYDHCAWRHKLHQRRHIPLILVAVLRFGALEEEVVYAPPGLVDRIVGLDHCQHCSAGALQVLTSLLQRFRGSNLFSDLFLCHLDGELLCHRNRPVHADHSVALPGEVANKVLAHDPQAVEDEVVLAFEWCHSHCLSLPECRFSAAWPARPLPPQESLCQRGVRGVKQEREGAAAVTGRVSGFHCRSAALRPNARVPRECVVACRRVWASLARGQTPQARQRTPCKPPLRGARR
jgi:hypothetical protein